MRGFKSIFVSSKHKIKCFLIHEKHFQTTNAVDTLPSSLPIASSRCELHTRFFPRSSNSIRGETARGKGCRTPVCRGRIRNGLCRRGYISFSRSGTCQLRLWLVLPATRPPLPPPRVSNRPRALVNVGPIPAIAKLTTRLPRKSQGRWFRPVRGERCVVCIAHATPTSAQERRSRGAWRGLEGQLLLKSWTRAASRIQATGAYREAASCSLDDSMSD